MLDRQFKATINNHNNRFALHIYIKNFIRIFDHSGDTVKSEEILMSVVYCLGKVNLLSLGEIV